MKHKPILPPLSRRTDTSENRVLPLINVVFLLLIFFMMAGKLIQDPPFEVLPATTNHTGAEELQPAYLAVGADGRLAWEGKNIERHDLALLLATRPNPDAPLQVRADLDLEAATLTTLLVEMRSHGLQQVQLLTRHQP